MPPKDTLKRKPNITLDMNDSDDDFISVPNKLSRRTPIMPPKNTLKRKPDITLDTDSSGEDFLPTPYKLSRRTEIKILDVTWRTEIAKQLSKMMDVKFNTSLVPLLKDDNSSLFNTRFIVNDGNSLFRSISYLIFEKEDYHRFIREAVIKTMLSNKTIYDKVCCMYTKYETVESYIRETKADSFGRQPKGFLELQVIANMFSTAVYLFTQPVTETPTKFEPVTSSTNTAFVLYLDRGYYKPVLKFDGQNFKHSIVLGFGTESIQLNNGNIAKNFGIDCLNSISSKLCQTAVRRTPYQVNLSDEGFQMLEDYANYRHENIALNASLFNFACENSCHQLTEDLIALFKECSDLKYLKTFLDNVKGQGKKYFNELLSHFHDVCLDHNVDDVMTLYPDNLSVSGIIKSVVGLKTRYTMSTEEISVTFEDGEFAFKDCFPYTVLCINPADNSMQYFTGPKPDNQQWVNLYMNRRLMDILEKITNQNHILFVNSSVFVYITGINNQPQIAFLNNVFKYKQNLDFHDIGNPSKELQSPQLVRTERNGILLVDKLTNQVYDLIKKCWNKIQSFVAIRETDEYQLCSITFTDDSKQTVFLRKPRGKSLFGFSQLFNIQHIPQTPFQFTLSNDVNELVVLKRLAEDKIFLGDSTIFQDESRLMYKESEPLVHYIIPKPANSNCIFALFRTQLLNKMIQEHQPKLRF